MDVKTIKKIHVVPFALTAGVISAVVGLIEGILMFLFMGILSTMPGTAPEGLMMFSGGIIIIVVLPIFAFIIGFIFSAILAIVYNFIVPSMGGIKVEVE